MFVIPTKRRPSNGKEDCIPPWKYVRQPVRELIRPWIAQCDRLAPARGHSPESTASRKRRCKDDDVAGSPARTVNLASSRAWYPANRGHGATGECDLLQFTASPKAKPPAVGRKERAAATLRPRDGGRVET